MRSRWCFMRPSRSAANAGMRPGRLARSARIGPARSAGGAASRRSCRSCSTTRCTSRQRRPFSSRRSSALLVTRPSEAISAPGRRRRYAASKTSRRRYCFSWASACCWSRRSSRSSPSALAPLVAGGWLRNPVAYVAGFRRREPARALSRAAQSFRRGHRDLYRDCSRSHVAPAGRPRRRDHGGRASAERLRSDQHRERLGRELHRRADRTRSRGGRCRIKWRSRSRRRLRSSSRRRRSSASRRLHGRSRMPRAPTKRCRASSLR